MQRVVGLLSFSVSALWFGMSVSASTAAKSPVADLAPSTVTLTGQVEVIASSDGRAAALVVDAGKPDGSADFVVLLRNDASGMVRPFVDATYNHARFSYSSGAVVIDDVVFATTSDGFHPAALPVTTMARVNFETSSLTRALGSIRESMATTGRPYPFDVTEAEQVCESGGPGSTSCDITSSESGCGVSCDKGYYACCACSHTCNCICVKDDAM